MREQEDGSTPKEARGHRGAGSSIKKLALSRQKYPLGSKGYLAHCWISCFTIKGYSFFIILIPVLPQSELSPVIYPLCDMRLYGIVGQTQSDLRSYQTMTPTVCPTNSDPSTLMGVASLSSTSI